VNVEQGTPLRVVGPDEREMDYLAHYTYHGGEYREQLFGPWETGQTFEGALGANGFPAAPAISLGGASRAAPVEAAIYVSEDAQPPEYLVTVALPGDVYPLGIYVPDWPSLSRLLRGELTELVVVLSGAAGSRPLPREEVA
jgi:hypothetical protein